MPCGMLHQMKGLLQVWDLFPHLQQPNVINISERCGYMQTNRSVIPGGTAERLCYV